MKRLLFLMLFLSTIVGILGCKDSSKVVVKQPVDVFKTEPKKIKDSDLVVIGRLKSGQELQIKSVHHGKDFAVYEIDLDGSGLGAESGFIYHDSRYIDVRSISD